MIQQVYTVRDRAAQAFLTPFFMVNDQTALRAFSDAVSDPQHTFHQHPSDYALYQIGAYDDSLGILTPAPESRIIALGNNLEHHTMEEDA